jgi:hypothetical protein
MAAHSEAWATACTEAARVALIDVFRRVKLIEVLAYTDLRTPVRKGNERLGLIRDASRDFASTVIAWAPGEDWYWTAHEESYRLGRSPSGPIKWLDNEGAA